MCPDGHYLLCNGRVLPLIERADGDQYDVLNESGESEAIDSFLIRTGATTLAERYPVLAYGANRNPSTLDTKFRNYGKPSLARNYSVPVLKGTLLGADVVACRLHGQGYFYGELLVNSPFSAETELEVRVGLVDVQQLRALNDSEGLTEGLYSAARVPDIHVSGLRVPIDTIAYVTNARVWSSPEFGSPIGFSLIPAVGRQFPSMTSRELMNHVLDVSNLRSVVGRVTGLAADHTLAHELVKYLNGQWWYHFNTDDSPISGYSRILDLFDSAMARNVLDTHTRDFLAEAGLLLGTDLAYEPVSSLRLGEIY